MRAQTLARVRLLPLARLHGRYDRPCARIRSFSYLRDPTVVSHDRYEVTAGASNTDSVRTGRRRSTGDRGAVFVTSTADRRPTGQTPMTVSRSCRLSRLEWTGQVGKLRSVTAEREAQSAIALRHGEAKERHVMGSVSVLMALAPSLLAARTSRPRSLLACLSEHR